MLSAPRLGMNKRAISIMASVILVSLLISCGGNVAPTRQIDDAILAGEVRDALNADSELRRYELAINVTGTNVVLMGTVNLASHRDRAEAITRSIAGVETVENRIEVRR